MIQIKNLYKSYGDQVIYQDFNLTIEEGKTISLIGPSGCGKTTLLRILAGLEPYECGQILGLQGKRVTYIFQEDRLLPWLNVEENIAFVLQSEYSSQEVKRRTQKMLELVHLEKYGRYRVQKLSGGMQRRVAIARALAYEGDFILMDEPFKGLDHHLRDELIENLMEYIHRMQYTVICVTHDLEEAKKLGEIIFLDK